MRFQSLASPAVLFALILPIIPVQDEPRKEKDVRWGAVLINGQKAGHVRWERRREGEGEQGRIVTFRESVSRIDAEFQIESREKIEIVETMDGTLLRFSILDGIGDDATEIVGEISDGVLKMTTRDGTYSGTQEFELDAPMLGPGGLARLRKEKGLAPGTTYTARAASEELGGIGLKMEHEVKDRETIDLLEGKVALHRIEIQLYLLPFMGGGQMMGPIGKETIWVDDGWRVWKEEMEAGHAAAAPAVVWGPKEKALAGATDAFRPKTVVEAGRYRNPSLGLSFDVPEDWELSPEEEDNLLAEIESDDDALIEIFAIPSQDQEGMNLVLDQYAPREGRKIEERIIAAHPGGLIPFEGGRAAYVRPDACCMSGEADAIFVFVLSETSPAAKEAFDDLLATISLHRALGAPDEGERSVATETKGEPKAEILRSHTRNVTSIAVSPDGRQAVSGSLDGTAKTWNLTLGTPEETLDHGNEIWGVAIDPSGTMVAAGGKGGAVRLWDARRGNEIRAFTAHEGRVGDVAFSPDGTLLATAGAKDNVLRLWAVLKGEMIAKLAGHEKGVVAVTFAPDGRRVATGSYDRTARIWDIESRETVGKLVGHENWVLDVAWSPDGMTIATASSDRTVKVFDASTFEEVRTLRGHQNLVYAVAFSNDGETIISGALDGKVLLWDAATGGKIRVLSPAVEEGGMGVTSPGIESVVLTPDGKILLAGRSDSNIVAWDLTGGPGPFSEEARNEAAAARGMRTLRGHAAPVRSVAFSPDGKTLASASYDNTVKIWDVESGLEARTLWGRMESPNAISFHPDGKRLAVGSHSGAIALSIWDVERGGVSKSFPLEGRYEEVHDVAFHPDGKRLVSSSSTHGAGGGKGFENHIRLWDVGKVEVIRTFEGHADRVQAIALTPDGETLITGGRDKTVRIWNVADGGEKARLEGHTGPVKAVAVTSDGRMIASVGGDNTIRLWDAGAATEVRALTWSAPPASSVALSPDGKILAAGFRDFSVRFWDVETGEKRGALADVPEGRGSSGIAHVSFSPDGATIAAAGDDGTVRLWQVPSRD